ncbi:PREDICTED: GATA transcription factor 7 [Tarenaya hassleriana]|uniref:GATA transcription factor 7 n=1 Tax=Tarenaya hassleriana TaxID=28532 RepID=UPI00053CA4F9|nr:PREDICTED: GATA transcription factor 7 [Tarenaya hassleriana]
MECVEAFLNDFAVDDLLDFCMADGFEREEGRRDEDEREPEKDCNFSDQSVCLEDLLSFPGSELGLPVGDLAELEWLSNFVEDSFSESYHSGDFPVKSTTGDDAPTAAMEAVEPRFTRNPVPVKPRTKRRRTSRRVWTLSPPSSATGPSYSSSEAPNKAAPKKGNKRGRRKAEAVSSSGGGGGGKEHKARGSCKSNQPCSHCGVQKTPQWRMGPLGTKTLCNACGVRFKSGRLLPEYRPASSPTFSTILHSNSHRKVLELRLNKAAPPGRVGSNPVMCPNPVR